MRRYSVDEALEDPARFFARCGQPLYLSGDLLFDIDRDLLRHQSIPLLRRLARLLHDAPHEHRTLRIVGHADERGDLAYNDSLSQRRAQRVASWLTDNGPKDTALVVTGRGKRELIVPQGSPAHMQRLNRRVEVFVPCP